jgi:hypothetical protein
MHELKSIALLAILAIGIISTPTLVMAGGDGTDAEIEVENEVSNSDNARECN